MPDNSQELVGKFRGIALVIEVRTCKCCESVYTVPVDLFTILETDNGKSRTLQRTSIRPTSPRSIVYVNRTVDACQKCFHYSNENQLMLIQDEELAEVELKEKLEKAASMNGHAKRIFTLDDFS